MRIYTKKVVTFLLFITALDFSFAENAKTQDVNKQLLEEKIVNIQRDINRLQNDINKGENKIQSDFKDLKREVIKGVETNMDDTRGLVNLYVFFITVAIIGIGAAINFLGKMAIKKRVEELIVETAQKHIEEKIVETLNGKITSELIENAIKNKSEDEINKILLSIEDKGNTAIAQIKTKGDEAIKSMLALPPEIQIKIENKNLSDVEITQQNDFLRADEFFKLAFNSKDPRIQIELYKNVLEITPDNYHALNNMAVSHNNLNETKDSIELLNKALKLNPQYFQAYTNRAQAYNLQDNFDKALSDIASAIKLEPRFEYAYAVKGNILTKQGKLPDAEIALNTAIEINPNSAEAHYNRAFFYEERNEYEKSRLDYEKAEKLGFGNKGMLYNNMAVLYRRLKEFDKAVSFIEKAKTFNPNFPNIDGTLALIYADKNEDENFYANLKVALEKGCQVWNYLSDPGFDRFRESRRLQMLIEPYKKKYFA